MRAVICCMCLSWALVASAAVPRMINWQGYLTSELGVPVHMTVSMTLRLYATATGGAPLWTETQPGVAVVNGVFNVVLGRVTPLGLPFDQPYFLGVAVGSDPEVARVPLLSAPYALRTHTADAMTPVSVTGAMIQAATITPDRFGNFCPQGRILVRSASGWDCGLLP